MNKDSRYYGIETSVSIDPKTNKVKQSIGIRKIPKNQNDFDVYTVNNGEDLFDIAFKFYKDPLLWWKIADANLNIIDNPYDLSNIKFLVIP